VEGAQIAGNNGGTGSVCTRCGKQRIVTGSHEELVGTSKVIYTETSCPDPSCQIAVDDKLVKEQEKREQMSVSSRFGATSKRDVSRPGTNKPAISLQTK
jgi:hypothetical protein